MACVDMSAPKGAASISVLQLPSPSVVIGDVMRDSLGAPAKLGVIAYDANGSPMTDVAAQFFITDSLPVAHFDASGALVGDKAGSVHIIGQVGSLQTPAVTLPITVAPTKITAAGKTDTIKAPLVADTLTNDKKLAEVLVTGAGDAGSQGFIVRYTLQYAPAKKDTAAAVFLVDDAGKPSSTDTTDASGRAGRNVAVNARRLADPALLGGQKVDSAVVLVQTSYKGVLVPGSPVRLVFPIKVIIPTP
jgi:hypothetical protein